MTAPCQACEKIGLRRKATTEREGEALCLTHARAHDAERQLTLVSE